MSTWKEGWLLAEKLLGRRREVSGGGGTAQGTFGCLYRDWPPDGDVDLLGGYKILTEGEKSALET